MSHVLLLRLALFLFMSITCIQVSLAKEMLLSCCSQWEYLIKYVICKNDTIICGEMVFIDLKMSLEVVCGGLKPYEDTSCRFFVLSPIFRFTHQNCRYVHWLYRRLQTTWQRRLLLTSFLLSLFSFCRCHLRDMWGDLAWHSRNVVLPSTPYCTVSRVFLLAMKQYDVLFT